jgi:hypothetical protein
MTLLIFNDKKEFYNELEFFDNFCDDEERRKILQDLEPDLDKYGREDFHIAIKETYGSFTEFVETILKERYDHYVYDYTKIGDVEKVSIKELISPSDNCPKCNSDETSWDDSHYIDNDFIQDYSCYDCNLNFQAEYTLINIRGDK